MREMQTMMPEDVVSDDDGGVEASRGMTIPPDGNDGFIVPRVRLVDRVLEQCKTSGITFICAPKGFGKTSLLLQCASSIRNDPGHGIAVLVSGEAVTAAELMVRLDALADDLSSAMAPCILIDDMPAPDPDQAPWMVEKLRCLRSRGFSIILACTPEKRPFVDGVGDSFKMGAQSLRVQPREYSGWARTFSINSALDVYELTQGIPSLVVALQAVTGSDEEGMLHLGKQVEALYAASLEAAARYGTSLYRVLALMMLVGSGSLADFDRCGLRLPPEMLAILRRDYPIIQFDVDSRGFRCLGSPHLGGLRERIAREHPDFLQKALRVDLRAGEVDRAIGLMDELMEPREILSILGQFPTAFALAGRGAYVKRILGSVRASEDAPVPTGIVLNLYLSALSLGDYRAARSASLELCRRAEEVSRCVTSDDWACAHAMRRAWRTCGGIDLPELSIASRGSGKTPEARLLDAHASAYEGIITGLGEWESPEDCELDDVACGSGRRFDLPRLLLALDGALEDSLRLGVRGVQHDDVLLHDIVSDLDARKMMGVSARVRMVASLRRLLAGLPVTDERAFGDAGTMAVRESDLPTQLLCLAAEGWQYLLVGQVVNAQFRGQQVQKLAKGDYPLLTSWARLLERTATILNSSLVCVREDAELVDLSIEPADAAEAWCIALSLSAARYDSDLSVWFSLHKSLLLDLPFRAFARLAMHVLGDRANSVRRLIPDTLGADYRLGEAEPDHMQPVFGTLADVGAVDMGQVNINLFGGFHVDRNGHVLTDELWRRKKAGVLAARLAISLGVFVGRGVLVEEMWPESDFPQGRQNLYAATSTLKNAFRQKAGGPQYVITQAEGLALNREFVCSDIVRFDMLAREVLLRRTPTSGRQIVESCLKLEELYRGPLFVPDTGSAGFFLRCRKSYLGKYVDCLVRGIDAAVEEDDLAAASWLVEALLSRDPMREDVLRRAMKVYGLCGRRREVTELYGSHLHYLRSELRTEPDPETRRTYEAVLAKTGGPVLL